MKLYLVRVGNDEMDIAVGVATTEEKAQKMIDVLKQTSYYENLSSVDEAFRSLEYFYSEIETDTLTLDQKNKIPV